VRLYVVQMFYSSLKESGALVAEAKMQVQFERIHGENFSLIAFEAAWIVGGNMSKDVSLWLERHRPSPFK